MVHSVAHKSGTVSRQYCWDMYMSTVTASTCMPVIIFVLCDGRTEVNAHQTTRKISSWSCKAVGFSFLAAMSVEAAAAEQPPCAKVAKLLTSQYTDAMHQLEVAHSECTKTANVDLKRLIGSVEQCADIVSCLVHDDRHPVRQPALLQLQDTLMHHRSILHAKRLQLTAPVATNGTETRAATASKRSHSKANQAERPEALCVDNEQSKRMSAIEGTIMTPGKVTFADVAGLEAAKQTLHEAIVMPLLYPHLFTGGRRPWQRILLYGPPGTGKTRLAQAVASEINSTFYCVSSSNLISSFVGESEKLIRELFVHARRENPAGRSVIFIDEIDSLCRQRSAREEEHTRRVKTELLKQMEGADNSEAANVFLLCATNCPWELDSAFLRRFEKRLYIPLPNRTTRETLLRLKCRGSNVALRDSEWHLLAEQTVGYSGSDLDTCVADALMEPVRQLASSCFWHSTTDGSQLTPCEETDPGAMAKHLSDIPPSMVMPRPISVEDFLLSLQRNQPTVNRDDMLRFEEFTGSFGQSG
ncbi:uncharacterized protein LOC135817299 isoform X2 [Sycon ciliatum]|uniref:uncharacterized protein LOC135817299 isoform X2 n=1 Tax=Sycon ciliatum TaxID=27933 RepID=UPI0031F69BB2